MTDTYSNRLRLIKRVGVLACLLMAAVVVFWPDSTTIQSADDAAAIEEIAALDPGTTPDVRQAVLQSVDAKNRPYNIYAEAVTNYGNQALEDIDAHRHLRLSAPKGNLVLTDETTIYLAALAGILKDKELLLNGQVSFIHNASGYAFKTEEAIIDLDAKIARGNKFIQGHNESSRINAQGFYIKDGGRNILFTGNAALHIYPEAFRPEASSPKAFRPEASSEESKANNSK